MPHPYFEFVDLAVSLEPPASPDAVRKAVRAARDAWSDIYSLALDRGALPDGGFGLFVPAVDKVLKLAAGDEWAEEGLRWYRVLFVRLAARGLDEVGRLIRRAGDVLEAGGSLTQVLAAEDPPVS